MQLGVVFPQLEIGTDPIVIRDYAQTAEGLGYAYLTAYDHVLGANPDRPGGFRGAYTHDSVFHEPLVLFGYLAGLTSRIELWTGIIILPQRQTVLVAKQAAEVAVLAPGRFVLGVGIGWNTVEYEGLGEDFHNRGRRMEEQIALLRELWSRTSISFEGRYHRVSRAGINPLPPSPIPIWMGGGEDRVLSRVGRLADGWLAAPALRSNFPLAREYLAKIHTAAREAGRDPASIGLESRVNFNREDLGPELEAARGWQDAGWSHLTLNTMGAGLDAPRAHIEAMRTFKDAWDRSGLGTSEGRQA
ncbi:MAG: LLM class F420-dependent oxidoreductase [Dehalococcoidia bacterium]|nr:LLM class F420-dependent oxidoreductase [Dehalococcoidia bacterium]